MAPLATFEAFSERLGFAPDGPQETRARSLLEGASWLIRDEAGTDFDGTVPDRVADICVEVARRAFINPEATGQVALGDANRSFDRSGVAGGDALYLTASEKRSLRRIGDRTTFVAVTMVSPFDASQVSS